MKKPEVRGFGSGEVCKAFAALAPRSRETCALGCEDLDESLQQSHQISVVTDIEAWRDVRRLEDTGTGGVTNHLRNSHARQPIARFRSEKNTEIFARDLNGFLFNARIDVGNHEFFFGEAG